MRRTPVSKPELERMEPSLRGKLDPPKSTKPPRGVQVEQRRDGTRVVSINIHQAVPAGRDLDHKNQRIDALRDVAAYVNSVNPDVVSVQEVRDQDPDGTGVPRQASVLYHLLDASDMAFTPALGHTGHKADARREYGTAIYTRNGHSIEQAHNVDLPNPDRVRNDKKQLERIEDRSAGLAVVRAPDGTRTTVVNAHLSVNKQGDRAQLREQQLRTIERVTHGATTTGAITYRDAITEREVTATGLPTGGEIIVTGDFNSGRDADGAQGPDDLLGDRLGLEHAAGGPNLLQRLFGNKPSGDSIDHVYSSSGLQSHGFELVEIPRIELPRERTDDDDGDITPTDHPMAIADLGS